MTISTPGKFHKKERQRAETGSLVYPGSPNDVNLRYVGCVISLKVSPKEQFPLLHAFLTDSGYTERAVCERLELRGIEGCLKLRPNPNSPRPVRDRLDLLARLFLIGELVEEQELKRWLPEEVLEAAAALELMARSAEKRGSWFATAALYPAYGLHIVSDRWTNPEGGPIQTAMDVVFPAITENTGHFMDTLPADGCESFLDLCSGTGIGALVAASSYAQQAWSLDITESSARCAEFNRLLNCLGNVTVEQGDLYEPVAELTFDRIAANPPYMPSLRPAAVFAYGGELGDQVTQRVVAGLQKHLRPGGRFYCITAGPDTDGEGFERRVRGWLTEASAQFDIFVFERRLFDPVYIANQQAARSRGGAEQVEEWKRLFEKHRVENFFYGSVVIQRKTVAGPAVTVRRRKGAGFGSAEIEWLRQWETAAADPAMIGRILDSRPQATRGLELHVTHRVQELELAPQEFRLETKYPFTLECKIEPWTAYLIPRCDGKTTVRDLLAWAKENGLVGAEAPEEEFADFLRGLISGGFLELEGYRLPVR
jgi:methylase of polypeptide subunit release factors